MLPILCVGWTIEYSSSNLVEWSTLLSESLIGGFSDGSSEAGFCSHSISCSTGSSSWTATEWCVWIGWELRSSSNSLALRVFHFFLLFVENPIWVGSPSTTGSCKLTNNLMYLSVEWKNSLRWKSISNSCLWCHRLPLEGGWHIRECEILLVLRSRDSFFLLFLLWPLFLWVSGCTAFTWLSSCSSIRDWSLRSCIFFFCWEHTSSNLWRDLSNACSSSDSSDTRTPLIRFKYNKSTPFALTGYAEVLPFLTPAGEEALLGNISLFRAVSSSFHACHLGSAWVSWIGLKAMFSFRAEGFRLSGPISLVLVSVYAPLAELSLQEVEEASEGSQDWQVLESMWS